MESLASALCSLVHLDHLPRTGWIQRGIDPPESIAGHLVGTAHLALALAPRVEPGLDLARTLTLALVHDAPEAWTGDLPRPASRHLPPGAKAHMEAGIAREHLAPLGKLACEAFEEYQANSTREARFVHLCDRLQLGVRLLAYRRAGHAGLEEFEEGLARLDVGEFEAAQPLLDELLAALASLRGA